MDQAWTQPKPGDLLLCYADSWLGEAIDTVEEIGLLRQGIKPPRGRPIYSHVAVYVGDGYVIEALGNGLVKSPAYNYFGKADVWSLDVDDTTRARIVGQAYRMLEAGYKYSYWDLFVQFMWLVFGLRIPWHSKHSIICSVFGYDCWAAAGYQIAARRNCAPEDIATFGVLQYQGRF
ncbi:MAG: hypothetical protein K6T81_04230 [Alicyclobacillus macrosporangiidus]|uniref:hypothetical protein n=1 Tax=Alicyclobacillus macrosporangiidus TaxID=392015 RepID=UPI0026F26802|nr:hypothetical protein [Alicyclobacillus macrosporangiidus]MCL6597926.1 hypothetical protein [Alicyclobacillus macrosporangiidus]